MQGCKRLLGKTSARAATQFRLAYLQKNKMKNLIKEIFRKIFSLFTIGISPFLKQQNDLLLLDHLENLKTNARNPLNKCGAKYFSQNDEDGITSEIVRRLGFKTGVFAEFGVGDGSENNTLILLANGWKGFWSGGEGLCFNHTTNPDRFAFFQRWINRQNIVDIYENGLKVIGEKSVDILSFDLDGNDYYLIEKILSANISPKLLIVEYNSKFPAPIKWKIAYDEKHVWVFDDYFGASLAEYSDMLSRFGYTLICCNLTGSNAFFIKNEFMNLFPDVPKDMTSIFYEPLLYTLHAYGFRPSPKTIEMMINSEL